MLAVGSILKVFARRAKLRSPVCPKLSLLSAREPRIALLLAAALGALSLSACSRKPNTPPPDGSALFVKRCSSCHSPSNDMRAPEPAALHLMSQRFILAALNSGRMKFEAKGLTKAQKLAIATYLAAPDSPVVAFTGYCARDVSSPANSGVWNGFASGPAGTVPSHPGGVAIVRLVGSGFGLSSQLFWFSGYRVESHFLLFTCPS